MERIERGLEERVWQRVMEPPEAQREDVRPLLLTAWEAASVYRHLTGLLTGKTRDQVKKLQDRATESVAALKGLQLLSGGQSGKLLPVPIPKEPARRLLEKSFFRAKRLMTEYTARTLDPEFGVVYQQLAERERENGILLAQLLGGMER